MAAANDDPTAGYAPFSADPARCPKCHGYSVRARWQPAGTQFLHASGDGGFIARGDPGSSEWMVRTCRYCGYAWPEQLPVRDESTGAA